MIIDTSALAAILFDEPEAERIARAIAADPLREMSAVTALELSIVVEARKGPVAVVELETLLSDLHVRIIPFDAAQSRRAFAAWKEFGKGRHLAGLNLGDCCTFACAAERVASILCKGQDFPLTDWEMVGY